MNVRFGRVCLEAILFFQFARVLAHEVAYLPDLTFLML
jgi:hypothetical protein